MAAPPVVWINGYPGVGKLTISRQMVSILGVDQVLLIDNHQLIDPVKLPRNDPDYRRLRRQERDKVFEKHVYDVQGCAKMIVFTDVQTPDEVGTATANEYQTAAQRAGRKFLPVYLHCSERENLDRVATKERVESGTTKIVSVELLKDIRDNYSMFRFEDGIAFDLDVSCISPEEAAQAIISHIKQHA